MKKILISSLILGAFLTPSFAHVHAQSFSSEQQATLDSLKETLIQLLIQQISALQAQIDEILAQQENLDNKISSQQKSETQSSQSFGAVEEEYDVVVTTRQALSEDYFSSPDGEDVQMPVVYFKIDGEHEFASIRVYHLDGEAEGRLRGPWPVQPKTAISSSETKTGNYKKGDSFRYEVEVYKNKGNWDDRAQEWTGSPKVVKTGTFTVN